MNRLEDEEPPRLKLWASGRLEPAAFPHPPKPGAYAIPATIENVEHLLGMMGLSARHDVIKKKTEIRHVSGAPVSMNTIVSAAILNGMNTQVLPAFVEEIANRQPANPVLDWIDSEPWDGQDRLEAICTTVTTTEDYPAELKNTLITRWLLSAAAAACVPRGFKSRGVLTLQGEQGIGKTSWIARLVPAGDKRDSWVKLDHHLDGSSKDSIFGAISHWIVEIGELDSSFRKDVARLKGFLTNDHDKMRRPYARGESEYQRRTVCAASVNDWNFLVDTTGNSRWWTLSVTKLDFQHNIDVQQLFAQLAHEVRAGKTWWLTAAEEAALEERNKQHRTESAIGEQVRTFVEEGLANPTVRSAQTASEVLRLVGVRSPSNNACKEAGRTLRELLGPPKRINGRDKWHVPIPNYVQGATPKPMNDIY